MRRLLALLLIAVFVMGGFQASAARIETKSYIGGTGDLTALCDFRGQNIGGACFAVNGETQVRVTVSDVTGRRVGGWWELRSSDPGNPTYTDVFCRSFTINPSRGHTLVVRVGEAYSALACAGVSAATAGTIKADFTPPSGGGCSIAKVYMPGNRAV